MPQHLQHHPSLCSETVTYSTLTYRQGVPSIYSWPSVAWQKVDLEVSKQTEECSQRQSVKLSMLYISSRASNAWHICLPLSLRFPTLEHCSTGGESLLPEEFKQWKERTGIFIHELYGQSEMVGEQAPSAPFAWAQLWPRLCWGLRCVQHYLKSEESFGVQGYATQIGRGKNVQLINLLRNQWIESSWVKVKKTLLCCAWDC